MRGFRQKKRRAKTAARNLHKEKGKAVTLDDVTGAGCPGHLTCHQLGRVFSVERQRWEPCARATRRFYKEHPEIIVDAAARAWWPVPDVPADE